MNVNAARRGEVRFLMMGEDLFFVKGGLLTGLDEKAGERSVEELGVVCDLMIEALRTIGS